MTDSSDSTGEEQASLIVQLPRLLRALVSGDVDGDPEREIPPVASLQVGMITQDLGVGGFAIPTCVDDSFGDDGLLQTEGNTGIAGCAASYPPVVRVDASSDLDAASYGLGCLAARFDGCGFEQFLEAMLKALTPSTSEIRFSRGTTGHGDGANAGFLRPGSILVVVVLGDENDCSAADDELYNPESTRYTAGLSFRCVAHADALQPVTRYVDGLLALRPPERIVYATIAGIPLDAISDPAHPDYDAILAHPMMQERIEPETDRLAPCCNVPGRGIAFPGRRMLGVGRELEQRGAATAAFSICRDDYGPAIDGLLERLGERLGRTCR